MCGCAAQYIPNKGEHQIRYYGWYSNKKRGMWDKTHGRLAIAGGRQTDTDFSQKRRMIPQAGLR
jgi:hypothetical protein